VNRSGRNDRVLDGRGEQATAEADPCGMTNKRTGNGKGNDKNNGYDKDNDKDNDKSKCGGSSLRSE
jgi:hypothetical protein